MRASDHWPLIILIAAFCVLAVSFSVLLPLNEAPDEQSHFDLIRFIADKGRLPITQQERDTLGDKGDASPFYHGMVALLTQHVDTSSLPQRHFVSAAKESIPYDTTLTTQELHTEDELFPFRGIVLAWHLARLVSIPLNVLTIVAAYLTALTIYPQQRYFALGVAGFVAFVPRFVINSAVISDDNLVIPLIALATYFLVRIIQGDQRPREFIILGVVSGLATITKYHSVVLLLEITVIFAILAWRDRNEWKQWLKRWVWVMLSFTIAAGWWFFFLFSRFNRVAELGLVGGLLAPLGDPTTTEAASFQLTLDSIRWDWIAPVFRTFWIVAGSMRVHAPEFVYQVLMLLTGIAVLGLARLVYDHFTSPRPGKWRLDIALLGLHLLLYLGIVFGRYQVFVARGTPPPPHSTQGRHLYPALISVAFFFVLGWQSVLTIRSWRLRNGSVTNVENQFLAGAITLGLLALSIATFFLVVRPNYLPYLPIVRLEPEEVAISHRTNVAFAEGLNFVGYNVGTPNRADDVLPVHLFWQATAEHDRNYLFQICLRDSKGSSVSCHWSHPAEGLYPTRAWDSGYLVRDEHALPFPSCLEPGNYELTLNIWPVRNDTALTSIDMAEPARKPLSIGSVTLTPDPQHPKEGVYLCTADGCYAEGQEITLSQTRQTLTVVSYLPDLAEQDDGSTPRLVLRNTDTYSPTLWLPFQDNDVYRCPGGLAVRTHAFIVDQSVVPGPYTLEVDGRAEKTLSVTVATSLRNFDSPPDPMYKLSISYANQLDLLGYDVDLSPRLPNDPIEVRTYWQSQEEMPHKYNVALHLVDNTSTTQQLSDHFLGGLYPNVIWAPGEFTNDRHVIQAGDQALSPGLYTLELRLYDYSQGRFEPLPMTDMTTNQPIDRSPVLGQVRVVDPARTQPPAHKKVVNLGQEFQLLGYDIADTQTNPGQSLSLALHWKAIAQPSKDYTVFTQLIGPDGSVWGQQDNQPQQGRYPTSAWAIEDKVVDRYDIRLREGAPAGSYRLLVGMYDLTTGERLPAIDGNGQRLSDDAVELGTIDVEYQR